MVPAAADRPFVAHLRAIAAGAVARISAPVAFESRHVPVDIAASAVLALLELAPGVELAALVLRARAPEVLVEPTRARPPPQGMAPVLTPFIDRFAAIPILHGGLLEEAKR